MAATNSENEDIREEIGEIDLERSAVGTLSKMSFSVLFRVLWPHCETNDI